MMKVILSVIGAAGLTGLVAVIHPSVSPDTQGQHLHSVLSPDFEAGAFHGPTAAARLTEAGAIKIVNDLYWSLSSASSVTAEYQGSTSRGLENRGADGVFHPEGARDVWVVTTNGITTDDPGGGNHMCGPNHTGATCAGARVYDHLRFIVDDKVAQVIEATSF